VPIFCRYKTRMKKNIRALFIVWLAIVTLACSISPNLPSIPPGWTLTPDPSALPTSTFTPTVTPTPLITERVGVGDLALFYGDYDSALLQYQIALQDSPNPEIRANAKWGEARIYFSEGRNNEALTALQSLITEYPQSVHAAQAYFLQGFVYYRLENYQSAADAWQTYLVLRPGYIDAYVQELRGDALYNAKDYASAFSAYNASIQAPSLSDDIQVDMKAAASQKGLGNYGEAIALYEGIIARAPNDYIKAQAVYEIGLAHQAQGQNEAAIERFKFAVNNYPLSYYAYLSLVAVLDLGGTVSELQRGRVDYFAGQYAVGIAAFDRYLQTNPTDNDGTAYYYRALSKSNLSLYDEALVDYDFFIANYPAHPNWADAWGEKAFILWAQKNDYTRAAETLLEFVRNAPTSTISSSYLFSAGRIYERGNQIDKAIETWSRLANEYPGSQEAPLAIFMMGILDYRRGQYDLALASFNRSLASATSASDQARALLWIGKTYQQLGDIASAETAWRDGQNKNSGGYYSERARDLLLGRAPFAPVTITNTPNFEQERADAEVWMRLTFNLGNDIDLSNLGPLASDERIIRAKEFWDMGFYNEARAEYENLRTQLETQADAVNSFRLTNYLLDVGMYRVAIFSARQILTIAGLSTHAESMMAPAYFSRIRYGHYFSELVNPEAQKNGLDPLFVYSVIRQESLFEGFVSSVADARGLMQVIPTTGAQIASELGKPLDYTSDDLYRPYVSIMFGTHYLAKNRTLFNGDIYATLAAYNGGPGNSLQWKELAGDDPDLFLESVRFEETRNYIRNIYEIFVIYRRLYGAGEQ